MYCLEVHTHNREDSRVEGRRLEGAQPPFACSSQLSSPRWPRRRRREHEHAKVHGALVHDPLQRAVGAQRVLERILGRDLRGQSRDIELEQLGELGRPLQERHEGEQHGLHRQADAEDGLPAIVRREGLSDRAHEWEVQEPHREHGTKDDQEVLALELLHRSSRNENE